MSTPENKYYILTKEKLIKYVSKCINGNIIHPNPLTPSEMIIIDLCLEYFKMGLENNG